MSVASGYFFGHNNWQFPVKGLLSWDFHITCLGIHKYIGVKIDIPVSCELWTVSIMTCWVLQGNFQASRYLFCSQNRSHNASNGEWPCPYHHVNRIVRSFDSEQATTTTNVVSTCVSLVSIICHCCWSQHFVNQWMTSNRCCWSEISYFAPVMT